MARIDRSIAGSGEAYPTHKLTVDMVPTDTCVLTIERARQVKHKSGPGGFFVVEFVEFPDTGYYTNATQEDALLALVDAGILSADMDDWKGDKLPMFKRENRNPETGHIVVKFYPATPDEYVEACKTWGKAKGGKGIVRYSPENDLGNRKGKAAGKSSKRGK